MSNEVLKEMNYITSDIVIAEVKNFLDLYWSAKKLDDSILFSTIRECLAKLKFKTHPLKMDILEVNNYKVDLPDDFQSLCVALACHVEQCIEKPYNPAIRTEERHVCELNLCETKCDVCHDDCGNMFKIVQVFDDYYTTKEWTKFEVLNISKGSKPKCTKDCFNFRSKTGNEIEIKNNKVYTTFPEGLIYIEYIALLERDGLYLIPDNERIIKWIKDELIRTCIQYLYLNGEPDLQGRLQYVEKNAAISFRNAKTIYRRFEVDEYYNMTNKLRRRYNSHRNWLWNEKNYVSYNAAKSTC